MVCILVFIIVSMSSSAVFSSTVYSEYFVEFSSRSFFC